MQRSAAIAVLFALSIALLGNGLDGMTGQFIRSEGDRYIMKASDGREIALHGDQRTRKAAGTPDDYIHFYVPKEGHAEFIQPLEEY